MSERATGDPGVPGCAICGPGYDCTTEPEWEDDDDTDDDRRAGA